MSAVGLSELLTAPAPLTSAAVHSWQSQRAKSTNGCRPASSDRGPATGGGLPVSDTLRKNGWQLAEMADDATPYGFQYLLEHPVWSADAAQGELCAMVAEHLGASD